MKRKRKHSKRNERFMVISIIDGGATQDKANFDMNELEVFDFNTDLRVVGKRRVFTASDRLFEFLRDRK
jgi:hypothetical protein